MTDEQAVQLENAIALGVVERLLGHPLAVKPVPELADPAYRSKLVAAISEGLLVDLAEAAMASLARESGRTVNPEVLSDHARRFAAHWLAEAAHDRE
jgi:hypothetical protein